MKRLFYATGYNGSILQAEENGARTHDLDSVEIAADSERIAVALDQFSPDQWTEQPLWGDFNLSQIWAYVNYNGTYEFTVCPRCKEENAVLQDHQGDDTYLANQVECPKCGNFNICPYCGDQGHDYTQCPLPS